MDYYVLTDKGNHQRNEDAYLVDHIGDMFVFALADGVGGLPKADVASNLAVREFLQYVHLTGFSDIHKGFEQTNKAVYDQGLQLQSSMATTLLTCAINQTTGECLIAHVGDSRAYLFGSTTWKTKDHSLVQELVELRIISEEGAFSHPEKHRLKQAIGFIPMIQPDLYETLLEDDSVLVLCTDGIHDVLTNDDIETIALSNYPKQACEHLLDLAREEGSTDDITIVVIHYTKQPHTKPTFTIKEKHEEPVQKKEKAFVISR